MKSRREKIRYERMFIVFSSRVEKVMKRVALALLALLVVSQLLLQIHAVRTFLVKVEQLEGRPYRTQ